MDDEDARVQATADALVKGQELARARTLGVMAGTIKDAWRAALDGSFSDFLYQKLSDVIGRAFDRGIDELFTAIGDGLTRSGGGGIGSGIGAVIGGLFGGGGGTTLGTNSFDASMFSNIAIGGGRAIGGMVSPGMMYPVNENTPNTEWFKPSVPGTIYTAAQADAYMARQSGGGGVQINYNPVIDARGADVAAVERLNMRLREQEHRLQAMQTNFNPGVVGVVNTEQRRRNIGRRG